MYLAMAIYLPRCREKCYVTEVTLQLPCGPPRVDHRQIIDSLQTPTPSLDQANRAFCSYNDEIVKLIEFEVARTCKVLFENNPRPTSRTTRFP